MTETAAATSSGGTFDVVVFDFDGVCTPSSSEFIANPTGLGALRAELPSVIARFRERGTQIALLSNEFDRRWMTDIEGFPVFDYVFVGSDNQIFKPDRRAFQRVLLTVGCDARQCIVVDDDETNCRVARSIGCQAVHFEPADAASSWAAVLDARPISTASSAQMGNHPDVPAK